MVHALARAGGGAKLPSVGLCLNASKAVSSLDKVGNDTFKSSESRKALNNVTLLGGFFRKIHRTSPYFAVFKWINKIDDGIYLVMFNI